MDTPNKPYAICNDCGVELTTLEAVQTHKYDTLVAARATMSDLDTTYSHSIRVLDMGPASIVRSSARIIVGDTLLDACDSLYDLLEAHPEYEEVLLDTLRDYPDFSESFENYLDESRR